MERTRLSAVATLQLTVGSQILCVSDVPRSSLTTRYILGFTYQSIPDNVGRPPDTSDMLSSQVGIKIGFMPLALGTCGSSDFLAQLLSRRLERKENHIDSAQE